MAGFYTDLSCLWAVVSSHHPVTPRCVVRGAWPQEDAGRQGGGLGWLEKKFLLLSSSNCVMFSMVICVFSLT